jgi:hypothetical protein
MFTMSCERRFPVTYVQTHCRKTLIRRSALKLEPNVPRSHAS